MKEKIGFYSYVDVTLLTNAEIFDIITLVNRGVAQLVARDVWEHAGSGDAPAGKNALRAKSKATKSLAIIEKTPL